jgi:hypothetical protein
MKCTIAKNDGFICPAVNPENGHCIVFSDEGVLAKERRGLCNYKEIRRPTTETEKKRIRIGQQKQVKKKVKAGNIE